MELSFNLKFILHMMKFMYKTLAIVLFLATWLKECDKNPSKIVFDKVILVQWLKCESYVAAIQIVVCDWINRQS